MRTLSERGAVLLLSVSTARPNYWRRSCGRINSAIFVLSSIAFLCTITPAHATLGGAYETVEKDRAHMAARVRSAQTASYRVHTLTLANRGVVREFTRGDGTVFAISWRGPGRPDLRQLLGGRFEQMQTENAPATGRRVRRPLIVNRSDLVMQSSGHPGAFWGFALLPAMQPADFSIGDLK
jgi:hypothetical protein